MNASPSHKIDTVRFAISRPEAGYPEDAPVWVTYLLDTPLADSAPEGQLRRWNDDIEGGGVLAWRAEHGDAAALPYVPPPEDVLPPSTVRKSTILSRLTDAQLDDALALMTTRQKERWRAPDWPAIRCDDPEARALCAAIGADPDTVLAPG